MLGANTTTQATNPVSLTHSTTVKADWMKSKDGTWTGHDERKILLVQTGQECQIMVEC